MVYGQRPTQGQKGPQTRSNFGQSQVEFGPKGLPHGLVEIKNLVRVPPLKIVSHVFFWGGVILFSTFLGFSRCDDQFYSKSFLDYLIKS